MLTIGWEGETLPKCLESPKLHRADIGGIPVFTQNQGTLETMRRLASGEPGDLAAKRSFQATREVLSAGEAVLFAYFDVENLLEALSDLDPLVITEEALSKVPPLPVSSFAAGIAAREGRTHTRVFLSDGPAAHQLQRLSPSAAFNEEDLRLIPEEALQAQLFNFSPTALADLLMEYELVEPEDLRLGDIDLRSDLTDRLGPRWLFLSPSRSLSIFPSWIISVEVRDGDRVQETLTSLIELAGEEAGVPLTLRPVEVEGSRILQLVSEGGTQTTGAFAVKGRWLTAALDVRSLKEHLRRIDGQQQGLLGDATISAAWRRLAAADSAPTGIAYFALPSLYEMLAGHLDFLRWQLLDGFELVLPIDPLLLPAPDVVTEHLRPTLAVSRRLEHGWLFEREGSLGGELTGLGTQIALFSVVAGALTLSARGGAIARMLSKGKHNAAQVSVRALKAAVTSYTMNNNRLPESLEVLTEPDPCTFDECYIEDSSQLLDPWGRPYMYRPAEKRKFEILSYGADGLPGGEGENQDISSRDPR